MAKQNKTTGSASRAHTFFSFAALLMTAVFFALLYSFTPLQGILAFLAAINLTGFCFMGFDKGAAGSSSLRVPENLFFIIALFGASPATLLAVHVFRHKTRKARFQFGLLICFGIQILIMHVIGIDLREIFTLEQ